MDFHDFCDFHEFCGFHDFWVPRGGAGGAQRGGPERPLPPFLGSIFHQNDQNTIGFISKSEKVKSLLEGPESDFSFSLINLMVFWSFQSNIRSDILRSYNNRGPPAGPGRGPVWGPSRGFRFSRFSQNFCIVWNFQEFL